MCSGSATAQIMEFTHRTMSLLFLLLVAVLAEGPTSNLVTHETSQQTIQQLIKILHHCGMDETKAMKRIFLSTTNITCNDGTPAGFYLRRSHGSRRWIVFLEGGWYCYDHHSCNVRWQRLRHLMTSRHWPDTRSAGGILSPNPEENQFWWNANHVLVPYCTSDSWSGTRAQPGDESQFSFMGAVVVRQVVQDLLPLGLYNASLLLLTGSSAGGTGVMVNLDPIAAMLHIDHGLSRLLVHGVSDSGWFLDRAPYSWDGRSLAPLDAVQKGIGLWHGQVPAQCRAHYPSEPWRCYFGYRAYPTLNAPLFIFQWLFDEAQMTADNVGAPVTKQQWDYIHQMGDSLRSSFHNVTAVFAPSCISHSVLTRKDWQSVRIDEVSLPQALHCWEMSHSGMILSSQQLMPKLARNLVRSSHATVQPAAQRRRSKGKKKKGPRSRVQRAMQSCTHHLIERCSWPQCNHSCPRLTNPFTGQEMDFIELLKSFGLDMMSVANALGIDIHTLNNMDHEELLNLLTQRAN